MRSKSDTIRFEILKLLDECPTHGYDLYLILSEQGVVTQSSYLYKILRSMKDHDLIKEEEEVSAKGPNKKILYLTKKGKNKYYERIIDSAKDFQKLITEASIKALARLHRDVLSQFKYDAKYLRDKKVFFPNYRGDLEFILRLIRNIYIPYNVKLSILVKVPIGRESNLIKSFKRTKIDLRTIDQDLFLGESTIDIINTFGQPLQRDIEYQLETSAYILKPEGSLFIFFPNRERIKRPKIFIDIMREVLNGVSSSHKQRLKSIFSPPMKRKIPFSPLDAEEIETLLKKYFKEVEFINTHIFLDVFLAQGVLGKTKDR